MTQDHCEPEIGQGLLLRMGKVLGTSMHPRESVFLGYSALLWLLLAMMPFTIRPRAIMQCQVKTCYMPFENMLNIFEICQKWKLNASKHCRHANHVGWLKSKQTDPKSMLWNCKMQFSLLKVLDAGMYSVQRWTCRSLRPTQRVQK